MGKKVSFSEPLVTRCYELPKEDRKSIWEQLARDRAREFRKRILDFERIFKPKRL